MTQEDIVRNIVANTARSIKDIADETGILTPNIRRILGVGTKTGTFFRLERGVYILNKNGNDVAVVHTADAVTKLPELAAAGVKVNMVILDPPYTTPAIVGRNRPQKFKTITPEQFSAVTNAIAQMIADDDSPVYYICSTAPYGAREMEKYTVQIYNAGFKLVAVGRYVKLQKDGTSRALNPKGKPTSPEAVMLFTKSGYFAEKDMPRKLTFHLVRPPVTGKYGRQTKKPDEMIRSFVLQGSLKGQTVCDPFAGTGGTLIQAVRHGRRALGIEIDDITMRQFIIAGLMES